MDSNENETIAKSGDSGQGVIIFTYIMIVLSIFAMGFNFWMTLYIGNYYPKRATYQIQRIDCFLTGLSQIGMIALMLGNIGKYDDKLICAIATGLHCIEFMQPIVSYLFLAIIP